MTDATYTNRYEIKYLAAARAVPEIEQGILDFLEPDKNGSGRHGYYNHSIYFDSPDYHFYREKREGDLVRMKPRLRFYRPSPDTPPKAAFLELKGRYDRIVAKRRAPIGLDLAERLLSDCLTEPDSIAMQSSAVREFYYLAHRFRLVPCVTVLYHRAAYFGAFYPNVRVTFDRIIRCSRAIGLDTSDDALTYAVPPDQLIVELKYNDKVPRLLLKRFNSLGLQQVTFSKFAVSVERTHDEILPSRFLLSRPVGIARPQSVGSLLTACVGRLKASMP
ncbi:MAG: VTC domain-containing protein [Planctomycetota bacterium]|jgi:hypothetical protein